MTSKTNSSVDKHESRRAQLVSNELLIHAARLFTEKGYAGTSLQDVADSMGVSRPALYHYINSKEDLLASLVHDVVEQTVVILDEACQRTDLPADARLEHALREMVVHNARKATLFRLLDHSESHLPPLLAEKHQQAKRHVLMQLTELVEVAAAGGFIRPLPARTVALGLLGQVNWVAWWYQPGGKESPEDVADVLVDMAIAGIRRTDSRRIDTGPWGALNALKEEVRHLEQTLAAALPEPGRSRAT
jgi:AcrR family transcriptional regulator